MFKLDPDQSLDPIWVPVQCVSAYLLYIKGLDKFLSLSEYNWAAAAHYIPADNKFAFAHDIV